MTFVQLPENLYAHTNSAFFSNGGYQLAGRTLMRSTPIQTSYHVEIHVYEWLRENLCESDWQFVEIDTDDDMDMQPTLVGFKFYDPNHAMLFKLACF